MCAGYEDRAGFVSESKPAKQRNMSAKLHKDLTLNHLLELVLLALISNIFKRYCWCWCNINKQWHTSALVIDGVTLVADDRVLVKEQTNAFKNGIYRVTNIGSGSTNWVLTRATPEDQPSELSGGSFVFVEEGTLTGSNGYVFTHTGVPTFGTTNLDVAQFSGAGQVILVTHYQNQEID